MDYVEIIELPAPMAQAVQILKTAEALGALGIRVGLHARLLQPADPGTALRDILGRPTGPRLDVRTLFTRHKGIAGLHHRLRLARRLLGGAENNVLYGRSRRQTLQVCRQRAKLRS